MRTRRTSGPVIGAIAAFVVASVVSLNCSPSAPPTASSVFGRISVDLYDSTFVDAIIKDTVIIHEQSGKTLTLTMNWTSSNPAVLSVITPVTTTITNSDGFATDPVRALGVSEGDAVLTGVVQDFKTASGQPITFQSHVSVAGTLKSLRIEPHGPIVLQIRNKTLDANLDQGAVSKEFASVRSATGRLTNVLRPTWRLLDQGPVLFSFSGGTTADFTPLSINLAAEIEGAVTGIARLVATVSIPGKPDLADTIAVIVGTGKVELDAFPLTSVPDLVVGDVQQVRATVKDPAGNVVTNPALQWSLSTAGTATISQTGLLTVTSAGTNGDTVTVLAFSPSLGQTGKLAFKLYRRVASILIAPNPVRLTVGQVVQVNGSFFDASGSLINKVSVFSPPKFVLSAPDVATVSQAGILTQIITGVAPGAVTLTVSDNGAQATAPVVVTGAASSIALFVPFGISTRPVSPFGERIVQGSSMLLAATVQDASGNVLTEPVTWNSSDVTVVTVNAAGLAVGIKAGAVTVRASVVSNAGVATTVGIIVSAPGGVATGIVLSPTSATTTVGKTTYITANPVDASGATASTCLQPGFSIDNSPVASVLFNGSTAAVTGVSLGTTGVRAYCNDNNALAGALARLAVTDVLGVVAVSVSPNFAYLPSSTIATTTQFAATPLDVNGALVVAPVSWSILPANAPATIDQTGKVTVTASTGSTFRGGAVITATSKGQTEIGWLTYGNAGTIRGQLTSLSGQYFAGSTVTATSTSSQVFTSTVNNAGQFFIVGLAPGSYFVTVTSTISTATPVFTNVIVTAGQQTLVTVPPFAMRSP